MFIHLFPPVSGSSTHLFGDCPPKSPYSHPAAACLCGVHSLVHTCAHLHHTGPCPEVGRFWVFWCTGGCPQGEGGQGRGQLPLQPGGCQPAARRVPGMGCCQDGPLHLLASPSGPSTGIPLKSKPLAFCASYSCEILQEGKIIPPDPCRVVPSLSLPAGRESTGCHGAQVCPWARLVAWPCYLGFPSVLQPLPANLELGGAGTTEGPWARQGRPRWEGQG